MTTDATQHEPDAQKDWLALLGAFGGMVEALDGDTAETSAALIRFGCNRHLVRAVALAWEVDRGALR